ncbi:efflux RND transporter periplasmic adaptor subunit [Pseudoalteromonas denitrificans]|uniref:RND family efflux transporter, MFP subunit n=1 Tax=Pseudoalteromonas denitrificans DSM 6059 TaxID=1123010 RepID=A0A1I1SNY4_9GAMM|nr:efflux RND transporter periplasmic adaptor subunit [Pseudoalteromonas denitrificans]SFD48146.1 RND family efflux transporter, MFP subunit [Pseudoalteromonas denitrificans DSM 6059]
MNKSLLQKILAPMITIVILLFMVAWLAGSFNDKVQPGLNKVSTYYSSDNDYTVVTEVTPILEPVAANIAAKQATIISSRLLARIEKINVRAGELVKKGDILVELEKKDLKSLVSQASEKMNAVQARTIEVKRNLDRANDLFTQKLIAAFELDKAKADHQSIEAELIASKQVLKQAQTTLAYATLISPINGRIVDRFAEPGNTAQPGNKLLSLYNPLSLRVEAQVREELALTLIQGQIIQVELPSMNKTVKAEIAEIVPAANIGTRSFLVKASIDLNNDLLPGMYGRMMLPAGNENVLYVPKNKLARIGQLNFIWLNIEGKLQRRFVRLGKQYKDKVAVISGLKEGDIIANVQTK